MNPVPLPPHSSRMQLSHFQVELCFVIGTPGRDISQEDAFYHISGYSQSPNCRYDKGERSRCRKSERFTMVCR